MHCVYPRVLYLLLSFFVCVSRENEFSFVDGAIKSAANRLHKMRVSNGCTVWRQ